LPLAEALARGYILFGGFETGRLWTGRRQGGLDMPHYEFYCERCKKDVTLILTLGERERGDYACPGCGGKKLEPRMGTFFSQTSRKA
jgi:putative FmdB family regulatory protein